MVKSELRARARRRLKLARAEEKAMEAAIAREHGEALLAADKAAGDKAAGGAAAAADDASAVSALTENLPKAVAAAPTAGPRSQVRSRGRCGGVRSRGRLGGQQQSGRRSGAQATRG